MKRWGTLQIGQWEPPKTNAKYTGSSTEANCHFWLLDKATCLAPLRSALKAMKWVGGEKNVGWGIDSQRWKSLSHPCQQVLWGIPRCAAELGGILRCASETLGSLLWQIMIQKGEK